MLATIGLFTGSTVAFSGVELGTASTRAGLKGGDPWRRGSLGPDSKEKNIF